MKKVVIVHQNKVLFRDEAYMKLNYSGKTLNDQVNDLIDDNKRVGSKPTIFIQNEKKRRIERMINL